MKNQLLNIDKIINDGGCEVHTPSKQGFEMILELSERSGIRWFDGSFATDEIDIWDIYKERTVIVFEHIKCELVLLFGDYRNSRGHVKMSEFLNLYCSKCGVDVSDLL